MPNTLHLLQCLKIYSLPTQKIFFWVDGPLMEIPGESIPHLVLISPNVLPVPYHALIDPPGSYMTTKFDCDSHWWASMQIAAPIGACARFEGQRLPRLRRIYLVSLRPISTRLFAQCT